MAGARHDEKVVHLLVKSPMQFENLNRLEFATLFIPGTRVMCKASFSFYNNRKDAWQTGFVSSFLLSFQAFFCSFEEVLGLFFRYGGVYSAGIET